MDNNHYFPTMRAKSLAKRTLMIPQELEGKYNFGCIAFQRWHQELVDDWIQELEKIKNQFIDLSIGIYEFPSLPKSNIFYRFFLDSGMRAGIRNQYIFEHTITLYIDLAKFMNTLGIPDKSTVEVVLMDKGGKLFWRSRGAYTSEKIKDLFEVLKTLLD